MMFGGMEIKESSFLTKEEQYFFPRSKKRRIQDKCRKKYRHTVPMDDILVMDNQIIAHPAVAKLIKEAAQKIGMLQEETFMASPALSCCPSPNPLTRVDLDRLGIKWEAMIVNQKSSMLWTEAKA